MTYQTRGEQHYAAKLNAAKVQQILLDYYRNNRTMAAIGADIGVATRTVCAVVNRQRWGHIDPPDSIAAIVPAAPVANRNRHRGERHHSAKLTNADVQQILLDYFTGDATVRDLARKYRVHHTGIGDIVARRRWKHVPLPTVLKKVLPE